MRSGARLIDHIGETVGRGGRSPGSATPEGEDPLPFGGDGQTRHHATSVLVGVLQASG